MPDNVVQMPTSLDRLAGRIRHAIERREQSREEWFASTVELCESLAEARHECKADITFGRWCEANAFDLSKDDRAAAVAMGQHLEESRAVLQVTERRSLQLIYRKECRFRSDTKPKSAAKRNPGRSNRGKLSEEQQAELGSAVIDRNLNDEQAAKQFGDAWGMKISSTVIRGAVSYAVGLRKSPPPDPSTFSKTRQADYERAVRAAEERLRVEIRAEERKRLETQYDEVYLPHINAKHARAERIIASHRGLMERAAYRKILGCLHPDNIDETRKKRWEEAFNLFKSLEDVLVKSDPIPLPEGVPPLPETVGELLARRKAPKSNR